MSVPLASSLFDKAKFVLECAHRPFGVRKTYHNDSKDVDTYMPVQVPGPSGHKVIVQSQHAGCRIMLAGSAIKALTGQNVAGSEDLGLLAELIYRHILPKVGVSVGVGIRQRLVRGEVTVQGLEITSHAVMKGQQEVVCALQALRLFLLLSEDGREAFNDQTVYVDKSSSVKSLKFYNKWLQLSATGQEAWESAEFLKEVVGPLLRIELCLKAKWFNDAGSALRMVSAWTPETAQQRLVEELTKLKLERAAVAYAGEPLESLSSLNNLVLALYKLGMPLTDFGGSAWFRNRRAAILEAGGGGY